MCIISYYRGPDEYLETVELLCQLQISKSQWYPHLFSALVFYDIHKRTIIVTDILTSNNDKLLLCNIVGVKGACIFVVISFYPLQLIRADWSSVNILSGKFWMPTEVHFQTNLIQSQTIDTRNNLQWFVWDIFNCNCLLGPQLLTRFNFNPSMDK